MTAETKVYITLEDSAQRRLVVDGDMVLLRRLLAAVLSSPRPQAKDKKRKTQEREEVRT